MTPIRRDSHLWFTCSNQEPFNYSAADTLWWWWCSVRDVGCSASYSTTGLGINTQPWARGCRTHSAASGWADATIQQNGLNPDTCKSNLGSQNKPSMSSQTATRIKMWTCPKLWYSFKCRPLGFNIQAYWFHWATSVLSSTLSLIVIETILSMKMGVATYNSPSIWKCYDQAVKIWE